MKPGDLRGSVFSVPYSEEFCLLERRSRGWGTLEYRISELGKSRLRWLRSQERFRY